MHGHGTAGGSDHQLALVNVGRRARFGVSTSTPMTRLRSRRFDGPPNNGMQRTALRAAADAARWADMGAWGLTHRLGWGYIWWYESKDIYHTR